MEGQPAVIGRANLFTNNGMTADAQKAPQQELLGDVAGVASFDWIGERHLGQQLGVDQSS